MVREINPLDVLPTSETEPSFVVAFRGYRRRDVDHYAAVAEAQLADLMAERHELQTRVVGLTEQLHQVQTEVVELRRRPAVDGTVSFRHLGHRAERILSEAEDQAQAIRQEATTAAREEMLQLNRDLVAARQRNAREAAEDAVRRADAENAITRARDEARRLLTAAQEEAARTLQASRLEADQLVTHARGTAPRSVVDAGWAERDLKPAAPRADSSKAAPAEPTTVDETTADKTTADKTTVEPSTVDATAAGPGAARKDGKGSPTRAGQSAAKEHAHLPKGGQADEAVRRAHKSNAPGGPSTSSGPRTGGGPRNADKDKDKTKGDK